MKAIITTLMSIPLFGFSLASDDSTECKKWGKVYFTYDDYAQNKIAKSVCLSDKGNTMKIGAFNKVIIKTEKEKTIYKAGEIFAITGEENIYRYFETDGAFGLNGYFTVLDTSGLIIYSQKSSNYYGTTTQYYYSEGINKTIIRLNINNLEKSFSNSDFISEVKSVVENLNSLKAKKKSNILEINAIYKKYYPE